MGVSAPIPPGKTMEHLLSIENLSVSFDTKDGIVHAVRDVSLQINK